MIAESGRGVHVAKHGAIGNSDEYNRGVDLTGRDLHGKDVFPERLGVSDLHETPPRRHGVLAAEHDHCLTRAESTVQLLLPVPPCRDAQFRIEVEKRIRELARANGLGNDRDTLQRLIRDLTNRGVIPPDAGSGLIEMIALGNRAAHGAEVSAEAAAWVLDVGPSILLQLDTLAKG